MLNGWDTPGHPDWWLLRLGRAIDDRQRTCLTNWWRYYINDPPLPQGPHRATEAYRDFLKKTRNGLAKPAVDAKVNRLALIGLADVDGRSDREAWRDWQRNRMNARQKQLFRVACALSVGYVMVGPDPRDEAAPLITVEHPRETIVDTDPATGQRRAALKAWYDDVDRRAKAVLFLGDRIHRYDTGVRSAPTVPWSHSVWSARTGEAGEPNQLGEPPVVEFAFLPDLGEAPQAAYATGIDLIDRINLGVLNRMTAERYTAFRQRYVIGHRFSRKTDPATGLEEVAQPFRPDPGSLWATENPQAKFGEFSQTDLFGYLKTYESDVREFLFLTSTPAYYMPGDLINVATDTVLALEQMHVAQLEELQAVWGEGFEDVFTLAARVRGRDVDYSEAEVRWQSPRQINPAVVADMGAKRREIGYPLTMVAEDMGESPTRIDRLRSETAGEALLAALSAPPAAATPAQPSNGNGAARTVTTPPEQTTTLVDGGTG